MSPIYWAFILGVGISVGACVFVAAFDLVFNRKSKAVPSIQERTIEVMHTRNVHLIAQNVILNEILIELKGKERT